MNEQHAVKITCALCGHVTTLILSDDDWEKYQTYFVGMDRSERPTVQSIFPNMPASDRELLISGICHDCQRDIFA